LLGSLIGGAIGGAIGRSSDRRRAKSIQGTELLVRLENGEEVVVETTGHSEYYPGDRVQLISSSRGTRVKRVR
jgi:outer membrane lipoprotein SlyB